jgi:hypothetical protein
MEDSLALMKQDQFLRKDKSQLLRPNLPLKSALLLCVVYRGAAGHVYEPVVSVVSPTIPWLMLTERHTRERRDLHSQLLQHPAPRGSLKWGQGQAERRWLTYLNHSQRLLLPFQRLHNLRVPRMMPWLRRRLPSRSWCVLYTMQCR